MNQIFRVIFSHVLGKHVVVSEIVSGISRGTLKVVSVIATAVALTIAGNALAATENDISNNGGKVLYDISPGNDGANIAVGKNAKVFIGGGTQESMISFGAENIQPTMWNGIIRTGWNIHSDPAAKKNLPEGIAVGTNSYARTGSIEIGAHTLGTTAIGDTTADKISQFGVAATTIGTNSYTDGGFATTIGSYNVQTSGYSASGYFDTLNNATKNAISTVVGTFNSNESLTSNSSASGVSNVINGAANRVTDSNGAVVIGAGNTVKNSRENIFEITNLLNNADFESVSELQNKFIEGIRQTESGGSTLVIGGGNEAEYTLASQITGVNNKLTGSQRNISTYNLLNGYKNTGKNVEHISVIGSENTISDATANIIIGDRHTLEGTSTEKASNNVILGSMDATVTHTASLKDTVMIGHNADAKENGAVALGSSSVASRTKENGGVGAGYDVTTKTYYNGSDKSSSTWTSTLAAVSVGGDSSDAAIGQAADQTRQITGVAAGTADTDAVNVSQLKQSEANFNQSIHHLNGRIGEVAQDANAGIAMALAAASLPQVYLPGKSMMAVAGGTYRGESGYAIGFSTISDDGKWIIKANAAGNSQGHYGAAIGAGYMW